MLHQRSPDDEDYEQILAEIKDLVEVLQFEKECINSESEELGIIIR